MTSNEIIATARRKLLEENTDLISDATLFQYANESYREIRKRLKMSNEITPATISCSNGVCTLPTDFGALYSYVYDADGNSYDEYSVADYEIGDFDFGVTIKSGQLLTNKTDVSSLTINYYKKAATLSASQDPEIDELFHEVIMYGVVWRGQEELQDEELATYYQTKFEAEFKRKSEIQSSYEEGNQRGGQLFTPQTLI